MASESRTRMVPRARTAQAWGVAPRRVGDRIEAVGTVLRAGRTLTVCQLEVFGVRNDGERKLVANGQQTLIRVNRPAP